MSRPTLGPGQFSI